MPNIGQACGVGVGMRHACVHRGHVCTRFLILKPLNKELMSHSCERLRNPASRFLLCTLTSKAECRPFVLECWLLRSRVISPLKALRRPSASYLLFNCHSLLWNICTSLPGYPFEVCLWILIQLCQREAGFHTRLCGCGGRTQSAAV
jgi:hypothetical protein